MPVSQAGIWTVRKAVLGGAVRLRRQSHSAQNAIHHAPKASMRIRVGAQPRQTRNAGKLAAAEAALQGLVEAYRRNAPEPADRLAAAVPEGLPVLTIREHHRRRMRVSDPIERAVQQELERCTVEGHIFPNNACPLRLVTAVLIEIDETWRASTSPTIN